MNTLVELLSYGQSYWLDNLTRKKITSGELKRRVSEEGLRGITSNPSIFNKAISGSSDYDEQIKMLVKEGASIQQVYDALTIKDVQDACDILKPVYDESGGADGFVSLEVSPYLARDTEGTMNEARRLFKAVGKQNCFIKIPGTKEGLPAIEQMLYEGININITLLFSIERYVDVAKAYVKALQRRADEGKPVNNIISVASFFISRIDTLVDQVLNHHIIPTKTNSGNDRPELLVGETGIISARLAYQQFKEIFGRADWKKLEAKGAHVQRPLWASTSNKNPLSCDVRYVETLIGDNTVNTLPDETIDAFKDHGNLQRDTIEQGLDEAKQFFASLLKFDIDINFITQQLENEGIQKFNEAYVKLMSSLAAKRIKILGEEVSTQAISYGELKSEAETVYTILDEKQAGARMFNKDATLWKTDAVNMKSISNRLGWLTLPGDFLKLSDELTSFAAQIKQEGYKHAVLLGMGGSSLCSEVARETFSSGNGYPELIVLDNTDPEAIVAIEKKVNLEKTLFIVASKSGTTKEPLSFFQYYYGKLEKTLGAKTGNNFIAITDNSTPLVKTAADYKFRKVFVNPGDIGGRYSVLSCFGILPMALMGVDIRALLTNAKRMETACGGDVPVAINPGISLGVALGICQRHGRDKVTFVLSSSIHAFSYWAEQLIAESTGKEGRGLIPVAGEALGSPETYTNDRTFVHMYLPSDDNKVAEEKIVALEKAGHPVVRIKVTDKIALGGEFYRWEIATAIAGMVLDVNPFDEPNVAESKKNTTNLLDEWTKDGSFKTPPSLLSSGEITIYGSDKVKQVSNKKSAGDFVTEFAALSQPHDYIALLAYFPDNDNRTKMLEGWRTLMENKYKVATTLGFGPRYLHSTGQLHKGGPATGLFIILMRDEAEVPIPGEKYGFATLQRAQALGDYRSLSDRGRRVILIDLGNDVDKTLEKLSQSIMEANGQLVKQTA